MEGGKIWMASRRAGSRLKQTRGQITSGGLGAGLASWGARELGRWGARGRRNMDGKQESWEAAGQGRIFRIFFAVPFPWALCTVIQCMCSASNI